MVNFVRYLSNRCKLLLYRYKYIIDIIVYILDDEIYVFFFLPDLMYLFHFLYFMLKDVTDYIYICYMEERIVRLFVFFSLSLSLSLSLSFSVSCFFLISDPSEDLIDIII